MDLSTSEVLIVGCARNCEKYLDDSIQNLNKAFSQAKKIHFLIIESDSEDHTVDKLQAFKNSVPNFEFKTLNKLKDTLPLRTDRIAFCRNTYLEEFKNNPRYQDCHFLVISDLDGVNDLLEADGVATCFSRDDWDVCTANQKGPYYDIWALRHPIWCPHDCWDQFHFLVENREIKDEALFAAVYSKMIEIPSDHEWFSVDSAFGGLAIYRRHILGSASYIGSFSGKHISEHVPFHQQIVQNGGRIFINPALINSSYTEHSGLIPLRKPGPMKATEKITVSYHDVVAAYKLFLNRMPENLAVIEDRIGSSTEKLLIDFLISEEFSSRKSLDYVFNALAKRALERTNEKDVAS